MKQAFVDMLVKKALAQINENKKTDEESLRLRRALANANKPALLKRLMA
ncbi:MULTISPECIES: hypothetical protein [Pseudobacteroides]|uniref:Uncharacterized protein n=1 Tax=Pseudobacteroides cellulosolvens ATCC 35603 = DSM 2933 TaxID=398512 RepID=A0A0L6JT36_9FIRM|nr:hypothetical protein [Pseudobacteroides cellulosolvens]KNY29011.1 hypothetical protein Bccel_4285 [Pseudobacteroides cellulosolvens ATCC 35603 = DSM 2933]